VRIHQAAGAFLLLLMPVGLHAASPSKQALSGDNAPADGAEQAIESAQAAGGNGTPSRDLLVRVEVLLDRAHFSPGEIDGRDGDNLKRAIAAYKEAHGLSNPQQLDSALLNALTGADGQPVMQRYTIAAEDEKGPFLGRVPKQLKDLAKLKTVGYGNPQEMLGEKFHMSPQLLRDLNPKANFAAPGASLLVARTGTGALPAVARVEVDKSADQVRAYDAVGKIVGTFPATVGSTERPAPSGTATVVAVASNPTYNYEPGRLTFGPKSLGRLSVAPGPNNPVGTTWISLSIETYGIHGTPDPELVGKTASHGCVRLTNWDAAALGKAVKKGTPVEFVGETQPHPAAKAR
jgi:lipoprotein-anchoring transpeptidase ErfK/SrfK